MKLFYLPHAGGTAASMYKWSGKLIESIEPVPLELPGRGSRYHEKSCLNFMDAVNDIFEVFQKQVGGDDYALAGHSMGATLIYELYYKILAGGFKLPVHMFFSGSKPPHTRQKHEMIHTMEDDLFLAEIKKLGGVSDEMLCIDKFKRMYTPVIKADYQMLEEYTFSDRKQIIMCGISVMYGDKDLTFEAVKGWDGLANNCFYQKFAGGHFYLDENPHQFASYINRRIIEEYEIRGH